ncbi:MAG: arginine repressor [Phycisphaerae bacterium]
MPQRTQRQAAILRLVRARTIATQEQLRRSLAEAGMRVNQATLSRDLRELDVRKRSGRYVNAGDREPIASRSGVADVVREVLPCGPHLIVIRTAISRAQPVALAIDEAGDASIVATLAGDDTVFVATRSRRTQTVALRRLQQWFGETHGR